MTNEGKTRNRRHARIIFPSCMPLISFSLFSLVDFDRLQQKREEGIWYIYKQKERRESMATPFSISLDYFLLLPLSLKTLPSSCSLLLVAFLTSCTQQWDCWFFHSRNLPQHFITCVKAWLAQKLLVGFQRTLESGLTWSLMLGG